MCVYKTVRIWTQWELLTLNERQSERQETLNKTGFRVNDWDQVIAVSSEKETAVVYHIT